MQKFINIFYLNMKAFQILKHLLQLEEHVLSLKLTLILNLKFQGIKIVAQRYFQTLFNRFRDIGVSQPQFST